MIKHLTLESFLKRIKYYKKITDLLLFQAFFGPKLKKFALFKRKWKLRAKELLKTTYIKINSKTK